MKARTICPKCKKEIIEDCEACIDSGTLVCVHKGTKVKTEEKDAPDIFDNIKWEILK